METIKNSQTCVKLNVSDVDEKMADIDLSASELEG